MKSSEVKKFIKDKETEIRNLELETARLEQQKESLEKVRKQFNISYKNILKHIKIL